MTSPSTSPLKKFTDAGIVLVPRSAGECLDLAFRFVGQEWKSVAAMTLGCAPAALVTWFATHSAGSFGWLIAIVCFAWSSIPLGTLLVTYASALAFRETLSVGQLGYRALWLALPLVVTKGLLRVPMIGLSFLVIPSLMLLTLGGFQTESRMISHSRGHRHEHRTQDLVKREYSDLLLRMGLTTLFGSLLWVVITLTTDAVCKLLFDFSLIFGPIAAAGEDPWGYRDPFEIFAAKMTAAVSHPQVLSALVVTSLFTYVFLRLAWFFTYIDLRIRQDCWDLEVALANETRRWEQD